jgi:hypothetical protein
MKSEIDILPESVFNDLQEMFTVFLKYAAKPQPDHFWSDENQAYISKVINDYDSGKTKHIYKTMEELEAYE